MKCNCILLSKMAPDWGLLLLRVGIGVMFFFHGLPKLTGGADTWNFLGSQMQHLGISFGFTFWGFLAAISETVGGIFIALGLLTRVAASGLFFTMLIATLMHLNNGDGIMGSSHSIEAGIVFLSLLVSGAGKYSLDSFITGLCKTKGS